MRLTSTLGFGPCMAFRIMPAYPENMMAGATNIRATPTNETHSFKLMTDSDYDLPTARVSHLFGVVNW